MACLKYPSSVDMVATRFHTSQSCSHAVQAQPSLLIPMLRAELHWCDACHREDLIVVASSVPWTDGLRS